jgi:prepilin-type N-terminal cleavage/methylation domain-containing protein
MKRKWNKQEGYTLIEVLVVMIIMGIILIFGFSSFTQFNQRQAVKSAAAQVVNDLYYAQSQASTGKKPPGCTKLDGYSIALPGGGPSDKYNISAECVDDNGVYEPCTDPECVKQITLPGNIVLQIIPGGPGPEPKVTFYTLNRGTNINSPGYRMIRVTNPDFPDTIYEVRVNKSGSIEP